MPTYMDVHTMDRGVSASDGCGSVGVTPRFEVREADDEVAGER
jgi:hypothetical protein